MISCPNKKLKIWRDLVKNVGENKAYVLWAEYDGNVPDNYYKELPENILKTGLKATDILMSEKAIQIFEKGKKANWDLNKILTELQVPKDQKQLILDLGISDREKIALELASKYSYAVEINISTELIKNNNPTFAESQGFDFGTDEKALTEFQWKEYQFRTERITKEEYDEYLQNLDEKYKIKDLYVNTSYYNNLSVPGGINYTEQEISTPLITPSIKGHAQFATDNGIGWFRSDEKLDTKTGSKTITEYRIGTTEDFEQGLIDIEDINKEVKIVRNSDLGTTESKTRRILEVQSDLFQKGRDNKFLDKNAVEIDKRGEDFGDLKPPTPNTVKSINSNKNQFLQLLNKDNNWVTFFIKSIIQDSTKKGYDKVLFPSGNTASKVEGHTTLEEFKKQKEDRLNGLLSAKIVEKEFESYDENTGETEILPFRVEYNENGKQYSLPYKTKEDAQKNIDSYKIEISQLKQELERVEGPEGFAALKPIYNFYENTVTNILNKTYGKDNVKVITDEYGNTWNEITLEETRDNSTIFMKKVDFNDLIGSKKNEVVIKEGVRDLFEENPELSKIGNQQQYSQYLDTIFPNSQNKKIFSHNTNNLFDKFDKSFIGSNTKNSPIKSEDSELGFFFTSEPESYGSDLGKIKLQVILNSKKPFNGGVNYTNLIIPFNERSKEYAEEGTREYFKDLRADLQKKGYDSINYGKAFEDDNDGGYEIPIEEIIIFEPEQIHILGSKQDIERFKNFVKKDKIESKNNEVVNEVEDFSKENSKVLFNDKSKVTIDEVLDNIINNFNDLSPIGKELITKAKNLKNKTGANIKFVKESVLETENTVMQIDAKTNTIEISKERLAKVNSKITVESFLHELGHAQSLQALINPVTFEEKQFAELISKMFKWYSDLSNGSESYGFTNEAEFVSELYTNKAFQDEIRALDVEENTSYWKQFIDAVRRLFGLAKSKQSDLLIEQIITFVESDRTNYTGIGNRRVVFAKRIEDDSQYSSLESKLDNFNVAAKKAMITIQEKTVRSNRKKPTEAKEDRIRENKELLDTLDKYSKVQKWKAVIGYTQSFNNTINHVEKLLNELLDTKNIYEDKLDNTIKRYKDYLSAYDLLPEIKELMSQADLKLFELTDEEKEDYNQLKDFLAKAKEKHDSIESKFLAIAKAQVLQDFSNPLYNTEVETKQRDFLIKEYNSLADKGGLTVEQYVSKMLSTRDLTDYEADLKSSAEKILNDPSKDISAFSAKLDDQLNTKDKMIQIVNQILGASFDKVKTLTVTKVHKMAKTFEKFIKEKGNVKLSELNKNLIEKDSEGNVYLKGKYSIKFKESFEKLLNEIKSESKSSLNTIAVQDINLKSLENGKKTISLRTTKGHSYYEGEYLNVKVNNINTGISVRVDKVQTFDKFSNLSSERKDDFAKMVGNFENFEDFKKSNKYANENSEESLKYPEIYNFINNSGSIDIIQYTKINSDVELFDNFKDKNKKYKKWFIENTTKDANRKTIPKAKYLNKELTGIEKEILDSYIKINQDNDKIEGFDSLITNIAGAEFHKLASMSKTDLERALELDLKGITKDKWTDLTKIKSDDIGIDTGSEEKNSQGDIIRRVKTAYRGKIEVNEQSLDLETMFRNEYWNGQNFKEKLRIEPKLLLITDIAKHKEYYTGKNKEVVGDLSNTYKRLVGMMERNVYDIMSKHGGEFAGKDINKVTNALNGYAAGLAMTFNMAAGVTNIANGLTQVLIDAVGGNRFDVKTFLKAEAKYTKEMMNGNLLKDMSKSVKTSYFNQLLEMFDVMGGLGQNEQEALRNTILRKFGTTKSGNFLNESGEHAMHSILTQSILDSIKAMDENNNYLDKDGNVTTEAKAASLADMLYFDENGQLQMNSKVAYSGFNLTTKYHEGGKTQINLLIKHKVFDLFGVYDIKYKNELSKAWWGKSIMMFKNFFMGAAAYRYTGFTTSYKKKSELTDDDRFYNSAEKEYIEGTYTTLVRFLRDIGVPNLQMLQTMYMNWNNLTEYERSNLKKATMEIMLTSVILPSIGLLLASLDGGDDDDDLLWFAIYVNRRLARELAQFRNPLEASKMIQNPVAGIRFIQNGLNFIYDVATPINLVPGKNESVFGYLDENSKGQNKMGNHLIKLVPIIPQIGIDYKQRFGLEFGK